MKGHVLFAIICLGIFGTIIIVRGGVAPTPPVMAAGATGLEAAIAQANTEGKVVFAVASADWCPPCQDYKRGALVHENVTTWLGENAVTVAIDVTDRQTINPDAQALGVGVIPATFLINADGAMLARAEGKFDSGALLKWLETSTAN